jgi:cell division protein FtsW
LGAQTYQSQLALGSGGLTGTGLASGAHYGNVPLNQSDFVFAILGEELGLVCTLGVVGTFALFVISGIGIAWRARDLFGLLLGAGLTFVIGLQAFVNIGVVIGLLPNKGLVLPFISKGGSSLLMMLVFVGVLISIARTTVREELAGESGPGLEEGLTDRLT